MTTLPIIFSPGDNVFVKVNDVVKAGQVIVQKVKRKEFVVNIGDELSVSFDRARKYLRKKPGDKINEGDLIAVKRSFFGLNQDKLISKVSGVFSRYERDTGKLIIVCDTDLTYTDIVSPVDGIVTMCDNDKIVLGTERGIYRGTKGTGGSATGEIFVLDSAFIPEGSTDPESEISQYYDLDSRAVGKIVVGASFPRDLLIKCIGMEAIGIVGTEISDDVIAYLDQRKMEAPILEVDKATINDILQWKNKKIYLNSREKEIVLLHA